MHCKSMIHYTCYVYVPLIDGFVALIMFMMMLNKNKLMLQYPLRFFLVKGAMQIVTIRA